ncbi:MAG: long-chain-fatty-acid--CoA ligase [Acidobacteria bacterium]|nr:long-chain-fatty-acid--CoA ligase [Acidobacteriota bacterium]
MNVPLSPVRCLYRAVDLYGDKLGVVSGEERYSYREFGDRCERLAAGLVASGVRPGDRVAFLSYNNSALLASYFAVPMIGAVLMPLNVRLQTGELDSILQHSMPTVLVYEAEFASILDSLRSRQRGATRHISIDGDHASDFSLEELTDVAPIGRMDPFAIDENSPAELFYTSGSTGHPKGVLLSHRSLYLHALSLAGSIDHSDDHVMLHTIPLFHANGWGFPQFATMCGMRQVMVRRFEPSLVLSLIEKEKATRMILVPTMANMLLNFEGRGSWDSSSLRQIIVGGAAPSPELIASLEEAFHAEVFAGYGLTESGPVVSMSRTKSTLGHSGDPERLQYAASTGWPVLGMETRVVDDLGNDVPHDGITVGEIVVRGDSIMDGYYLDQQQTAAATGGGWLHTGDMAVWNDEGWPQIVDRKKDIIVSGGENIASIEVEQAICLHPSIMECAVVAAPHPHWGEVPVAIVVLKTKHALTEEQLLAFISTRIARFKLPRSICFSEVPLPKTGTGKVMKQLLRDGFWQGKQSRVQG